MPLSFAVEDKGILPDRMIAALARDGGILPATDFAPDQIQPASLDLRLGDVAYRVRASFLPGSTTVARRIDELKLHEFALDRRRGAGNRLRLYRAAAGKPGAAGRHFGRRQSEKLDRPARCVHPRHRRRNARLRPARGRLSRPALCRDSARARFPLLVREGSRLSQIRFRRGGALLGAEALRELHARERLVDSDDADVSEGVAVGVDLSGIGPGGLVGYRAKRHTGVIDVERRAGYAVLDFWEPMQARPDKSLILDPNEFYILASKEAVQVPPDYAAEMVPFDPLVGEFRVHYAGFFDPGFGYAGAGGKGARAVLEVRSREVPFILEHGQIVGRLVYEKMMAKPDKLYGQGIGSNYQAQSLKLSQAFQDVRPALAAAG